MEKEYRALAQAEREILVRWYEGGYKTIIACSIFLFNAIHLLGVAKFGDPVAHLTAAVIYITSAIVDDETTLEGFEAKDMAREAGFNLISGVNRERNIFLSHIETAESYKAEKKKRLIMGGVGLALSIFPAVGIGVGGMKLLAAMNNHRRASRINRATEIALNESKTD